MTASLRRHLRRTLLGAVLLLAGPALAQTPEEIAAVQAFLAAQGYDPGPADGMMGSRTREAIGQYEVERGQEPTGEVSAWLIEVALGGGGAAATGDGLDASEIVASVAVPLTGDPAAYAGTGTLAFSERDDGALFITDGFPWRPGIVLPERTLEIVGTSLGLFETSPQSLVPVPIEGSMVEVPGSTFVPLFLAVDRDSAVRGSIADAAGITWVFAEGDLRFEASGYVLTAAAPGATISFSTDGVLLTGFELAPQ